MIQARKLVLFSRLAVATSIVVGTACSIEPHSRASAQSPTNDPQDVPARVSYDVVHVVGGMGFGGTFLLADGGQLAISQTLGHEMYTSIYRSRSVRSVERDLDALLGKRLALLGQALADLQKSSRALCPTKLVFAAPNVGVVVDYITECTLP